MSWYVLIQKKSNEALYHKFRVIHKKAMGSRDKKAVQKIQNLEEEYEKKLGKLQKEAEKTMDPNLRIEWRQAHKVYCDDLEKRMIRIDRV